MHKLVNLIYSSITYQYILVLAILSLVIPGSRSLDILEIKGPSVVVNGSTTQLVLDCQYDLTDNDTEGMVVKWYFNRQPFPVYQWIPHNVPQDLGILKGRLNLSYQVSNDVYSKHRALAILNPTTELTGEYACWISSFNSEDFAKKKLIVYAPATDMSMTYIKPSDESVIVSCRAGGISPAPNIALYRSTSDSRVAIEGGKVETKHFPELRSYNISIEHEIFDYELVSETMFECVLTIPGTEYEVHEEILYFPGPSTTTTTTTTTTSTTTSTTTPIPPSEYDEGNNGDDDDDGGDDEAEMAENGNDKRDSEAHESKDKPYVAESVSGAESLSVSWRLFCLSLCLVIYRIYLQ